MVDIIDGTATLLTRRLDFKAYNVIDGSNLNPYSDITLCDEGKVYDTAVKQCTSNILLIYISSFNY